MQWYYLVLISSVLMGLSTIIQKQTLIKEHASAYSASFSVIAAIVGLFLLPFAGYESLPLWIWAMIALNALLSAGTYLLNSRIFKHESLSVASPIFSSLPSLFTVIFAFVFLGEQLSVVQYLSIGIMVAATYALMFQKDRRGFGAVGKKKYVIFIFATVIITAITAVQTKYILSNGVDYITFLIVSQALIAVYFLIYMQLVYGGLRETIRNLMRYKEAIISTAVLTNMYRIFYYLGITLAPIALVTPLRNTAYVLMTVVSGSVMFNEKDFGRRMVLSIVLLMALYLLVVGP